MRTQIAVILLALSCSAAGMAATSPHMGTWKLNEAKSKIAPGMSKNITVTYSSEHGKIKVTTEGMDAQGNATHGVWVGNFDGKAHPVKGQPSYDMLAYKVVNERTNDITGMKDGKTAFTGRITVAADGKSRTVAVTATANGKHMKELEFYDKE